MRSDGRGVSFNLKRFKMLRNASECFEMLCAATWYQHHSSGHRDHSGNHTVTTRGYTAATRVPVTTGQRHPKRTLPTKAEAVEMYARYWAARFEITASKSARKMAHSLELKGDHEGLKVWNQVADIIDRLHQDKDRSAPGDRQGVDGESPSR